MKFSAGTKVGGLSLITNMPTVAVKIIPLFLLVGMFAVSGWAEEKDFRGWKKGDWVRIDLDIEPYNHKMWEIDSVTKMDCSSLILLSHTIWARIHEVSSEHLLVTTYFVSRISFLDKAEELAKRKSNKRGCCFC